MLGIEEIVGGDAAVATRVLRGTPLQVEQLRDHFGFAGVAEAQAGDVAILLRIRPEMLEACIPMASSLGSHRIDFVQVVQHRLDGGVQAVKVQSIKAGFDSAGWK